MLSMTIADVFIPHTDRWPLVVSIRKPRIKTPACQYALLHPAWAKDLCRLIVEDLNAQDQNQVLFPWSAFELAKL